MAGSGRDLRYHGQFRSLPDDGISVARLFYIELCAQMLFSQRNRDESREAWIPTG